MLKVRRAPGDASSWLEADVKKHKSTAHTPQRKRTASGLVSDAKESCYSSPLFRFEISRSSFLLTIIAQFTLQSLWNSHANSILGCICLDKWLISSYILAIQHFCLYSKYLSFSQGKQTLDRIRAFQTILHWPLILPMNVLGPAVDHPLGFPH